MRNEVFNLLRDIKYNNDADDQENGKEKRSEEFLQNVTIQYGKKTEQIRGGFSNAVQVRISMQKMYHPECEVVLL